MSEQEEIWRNVPHDDYENKYEVSNIGNIRSKRTLKNLKKESHMGYHRVSLAGTGLARKSEHFYVHRVVAAAFVKCNDHVNQDVVNHIDGDKHNNVATNLEWCTYKENNAHALNTGLRSKGSTPIIVTDCNGEEFEYQSQKDARIACEVGENTILRALKSGKEVFGLKFRYKDPTHHKKTEDLSEFTEVKDYPGYFINKDGKVYSTVYERFLKPRIFKSGYYVVGLCKNGKCKTNLIHRIMAETFIPNPDNHPVVNHIDHDKLNNTVPNLEWVTHKENTQKYHIKKRNDLILSQS